MLWKSTPPKRRTYSSNTSSTKQQRNRSRIISSSNNSMSCNGSTSTTNQNSCNSSRGTRTPSSSFTSSSSSSNMMINNYNHHQQYHQEQLSGIKWTGIGIFLCIVIIQFVSFHDTMDDGTTTSSTSIDLFTATTQTSTANSQLRGMEEVVGGKGQQGGFKYYYDHHLYNYPHHHNQQHQQHQQNESHHHDHQRHDHSQEQTTNEQEDQQLLQRSKEDHDTNDVKVEYYTTISNRNHHKQLIYPQHDEQQQEQQQQVQGSGQQPIVEELQTLEKGNKEEEIPGKWICEWSPTSHDECNELLYQRLPYVNGTTTLTRTLSKTTSKTSSSSLRSNSKSIINAKPKRQRWLFMGDSTMRRQFSKSNLNEILVGKPYKQSIHDNSLCGWTNLNCEIRHSDRCGLDVVFGLVKNPKWRKPSYFPNFEGPVNYGLTHPYCSDCSGCDPEFLHCSSKEEEEEAGVASGGGATIASSTTASESTCNEKKMVYGGYFMIEFAKDVELQSSRYRTTQENIAWYMEENYNKPKLVEEWGKPICVILTGFHDMILLIKAPDHYNMERFVENVEWYLIIMKEQCSHIVWMTNTAPSAVNPK